jgi:hypothetical protein
LPIPERHGEVHASKVCVSVISMFCLLTSDFIFRVCIHFLATAIEKGMWGIYPLFIASAFSIRVFCSGMLVRVLRHVKTDKGNTTQVPQDLLRSA